MKIASFNIENLFHRDSGLVHGNKSRNFQSWVDEFHRLMGKSLRSDTDYGRLRELAFLLGFTSKATEPYLVLRQKGGQLYVKPRGSQMEERATDKVGWNGWVQVHSLPITEKTVKNKALAIATVNPDVLVLQEVEDGLSLAEFNAMTLVEHGMAPFEQLFHLEGNSKSGLGMAILTKKGYEVDSIRSHAHKKGADGQHLFDIDCPEYTIITPRGESVTVINGHFPKGGTDNQDHFRRKAQAEHAKNQYKKLLMSGHEHVLICGTLNDVPYSDALSPLLRDTCLRDISKHDGFEVDSDRGGDATYFRMGAYRKGVNLKQRDYMLCSPVLFAKMDTCGMERRGVWPIKKTQWNVYPTVTSKENQASGHPLLWGQFQNL
ncbi:endonuclease/exonuclease/phosphatase family protein [Flagellimonas flava]|uniref:endonuclease/exonuclease/phosphatase family protein n=1 Tax=Flagellimonas flava TaxID=570519 RepID=UPI003D6574FC